MSFINNLKTEALAVILGVKPQTVRKRWAQTGSYFGIVPKKLPNRRLLWPIDAVQRLLSQGGK